MSETYQHNMTASCQIIPPHSGLSYSKYARGLAEKIYKLANCIILLYGFNRMA